MSLKFKIANTRIKWNYKTDQNIYTLISQISDPTHGEVYSIQHYVIKFVNNLRQVGGFLLVLPISSTNKTDLHNITEILLNVALNTITLTLNFHNCLYSINITKYTMWLSAFIGQQCKHYFQWPRKRCDIYVHISCWWR